jgi:hypothetical protein
MSKSPVPTSVSKAEVKHSWAMEPANSAVCQRGSAATRTSFARASPTRGSSSATTSRRLGA